MNHVRDHDRLAHPESEEKVANVRDHDRSYLHEVGPKVANVQGHDLEVKVDTKEVTFEIEARIEKKIEAESVINRDRGIKIDTIEVAKEDRVIEFIVDGYIKVISMHNHF